MGIFDFLTKESKGKNSVYVEDNKLVIPRELFDKLIAGINEDTKRKVIRIKTEEKDNIGLTDSKFGGYPYWEDGMEYPVNYAGEKLILLAQINLSDVHDERLPATGLLQFFISCDDIMGADDDKGYKVVYHKEIDPSVTEESIKALGIRAASDLNKDHEIEEYMPLEKCFAVKFSEDTESISHCCNAFEKVFADKLRELYGIDMDAIELGEYYRLYKFLNENDNDYLNDNTTSGQEHKMFGYPFFTQDDPREIGENDILLFQMDTEIGEFEDRVMWGDGGVGAFFISEENLKNLDFDKAFYNWDCC